MSNISLDFKELSVSERIQLVEDIWDSIADETPSPLRLAPGECAELHRRLAEHQDSPGSAIAWEQVRPLLFSPLLFNGGD